ncbi:hypothetical protein D3C76_1551570 [compost metagenome]
MRLDFPYVHPSWNNDGEAVSGLDLCFLPMDGSDDGLETELVVQFLQRYYTVLPNKPQAWYDMVEGLKTQNRVQLLPI